MAVKSKDPSTIENFLMYGIDIHHRRIYFGYLDHAETEDEYGHDFHFTSVALAIRGIDKMLDFTNKEPIEIHMTSFGGEPYNMLALLDKILECPCPVKFYGRGRISSSASWIMAVCDERYLAENTNVMIHDGSDGFGGKMTDMEIYTEEATRLQDRLNKIYAENSRMPKSFWDAIVRRDVFLTAEETVLLGLADAIIPYRGRSQFRKGVRAKNLSTKPPANKLKRLVNKIAEQTKMTSLKSIEIHVPQDREEVITPYDNSEQETKLLESTDESDIRKD